MIEVVSIELGAHCPDVEVETYTYYNRLRSIHNGFEITLFTVISVWRGDAIKWMEYSR
jgi:hypothetical protein